MLFGPLGPSLASYVQSSKSLVSWIKPLANWYANAAGYRKYGFKYDDLRKFSRPSESNTLTETTLPVCEEHDQVQRVRLAVLQL
jgi:ubiquinol-cytochrome c reductase subunit 7